MTKYYLVRFKMDWADEFDVCGMSVCDETKAALEAKTVAEHADYVFDEIGFGTNESFYELSLSELYHAYHFEEISESTYRELLPMLVQPYCSGWGTWFNWPSEVLADHMEYDNE